MRYYTVVAAQLGVSETIVASALAGKQTVGTSGAAFAAIWGSLAEWESATVVLLKGGAIRKNESADPVAGEGL